MFMSTNNTNNTNYRSLKATLPKLDDYYFDDYDLADILEREEQLDSSGQIGDYDDLESIHRQIRAARLSLYKVTLALNDIDRELTIQSTKMKRVWNRIYLDSTGTDKIKTLAADIEVEQLNDKVIGLQFKKTEMQRKAQFLRDDLRTLEVLSNDYRQMMRIRQ